MRTVHRFMAAGRPARAPRKRAAVVTPADQDHPRSGLLLEVAFEAKGRVALHQHLAVDRPVNRVAGRAAFAHRLMLENKWTPLCRVTLAASLPLNS